MGWNEIIFGGLIVIGLGAFFFFGRFRAGKAQRDTTRTKSAGANTD